MTALHRGRAPAQGGEGSTAQRPQPQARRQRGNMAALELTNLHVTGLTCAPSHKGGPLRCTRLCRATARRSSWCTGRRCARRALQRPDKRDPRCAPVATREKQARGRLSRQPDDLRTHQVGRGRNRRGPSGEAKGPASRPTPGPNSDISIAR